VIPDVIVIHLRTHPVDGLVSYGRRLPASSGTSPWGLGVRDGGSTISCQRAPNRGAGGGVRLSHLTDRNVVRVTVLSGFSDGLSFIIHISRYV
jgi:hypothetical protein